MRTILFDLDGVIVDSMPAHAQAWQLAFEQVLGIQIPEDIIYRVEGKPNKYVINDVMDAAGNGQIIDESLALQLNEMKNEIFGRIFKIKAVSGAHDLISRLFHMDYQLGVATGSNKVIAEEMLSELAVRHYFKEVISAEDVIKGKPDPEPYLKLLNKLDSELHSTLVIENAPLGIQSAKAAGLICLAVASNNPVEGLQEADAVFENLNEMQQFFEKEFELTSGKGSWNGNGRLSL